MHLIEVSHGTGLGHELPDALIQGAVEQQVWAGAIDAPLTVK